MEIVKVRRVGNSNVISLPRVFAEAGYGEGTTVLIEQLETGELRIIPTSALRAERRALGRRIIEENQEALELLAAYDRGEITLESNSLRKRD